MCNLVKKKRGSKIAPSVSAAVTTDRVQTVSAVELAVKAARRNSIYVGTPPSSQQYILTKKKDGSLEYTETKSGSIESLLG